MRTSPQGLRAVWLFGWLLLALPFAVPADAAAPEKSDIRVLIDISGSMRQNDPGNLRRPALRMLAGLLQPGTRAGVWTFARWVNNLVAVADVDAAWKKRTQSLSEQISSPGQFTNIEEVLDRASRDWGDGPITHARHLVLLTDGMVDVSKDPRENDESRARILDALLPRLKAAGVKVHTIALSARADHELMKRLAGETGGRYQQVASADELQRVFLHMFETVGKPDSVPLHENRFIVDGSISEATALVFSKPESPPVVLRSPAGEEYKDSDLPAGIAWFHDQGYDLITIAGPQKGEWTLQADSDPDNRVMIVTDLKLQTSEIPAHIAVGETTHVEAYLSNAGELVDRQAFLRLLNVRADATTAGATNPQSINDAGEDGDERAADGRYGMRYSEQQSRDEVELTVSVDSPTFMREKRYRFAVHEPVEGQVNEAAGGPVLAFSLQTAVMQPGAEVDAWQEDAAGRRIALSVTESAPGEWTAPLADAVSPSYVRVSGSTRLGNLIERTVGPLMPAGVAPPPAVAVPPPETTEPSAEPPQQPVNETAAPDAGVPEPAMPVETKQEDDWFLPAVLFGGVNLTLLLVAGAWFLLRRRRGVAADELELDELVEDRAVGNAQTDAEPLRENAA